MLYEFERSFDREIDAYIHILYYIGAKTNPNENDIIEFRKAFIKKKIENRLYMYVHCTCVHGYRYVTKKINKYYLFFIVKEKKSCVSQLYLKKFFRALQT